MREAVDMAKLNNVLPPCPTGPDIAQAVRTGRADCGIATRSVANAAGLDFVSLTWERFDCRQAARLFPAADAKRFCPSLRRRRCCGMRTMRRLRVRVSARKVIFYIVVKKY
jgi:hypothetical protein